VPRLRIDFREGFAGDTVEIALDGRVVCARAGVRADGGRAEVVEIEIAAGTATIDVRLTERRLEGRLRTRLAAGTNQLAVAVAGDRIAIQRLDEPPPYL
jgi:hypothetical protein